jgi:bromodomain adjacent to zinc finger domain protein 1A
MPLLKKRPFKKRDPPPGLEPDDEVFYCEATKEVFRDYDSFFQRTILCNSLVWSCSVTGKSNLTYEEAVESEKKARKRLGDIPKPLKRGLLWIAAHTSRGRISDLVDDVYVFSNARYFMGEIVEGIIGDLWCDCKVLKVIPPTQEEIDKDAEEEREEEKAASKEDSPTKKKTKKSFFPPEYLFKYELQETDPDDPEANPVSDYHHLSHLYNIDLDEVMFICRFLLLTPRTFGEKRLFIPGRRTCCS